MKLKKSTITKGFILFVLLSVGVMMGILIWTTDDGTWKQFGHFQLQFIPLLLALGVVRWYLDGMSFVALVKKDEDCSLSMNRATSIRIQGNLIAAVVPVAVGTFAMHGYLLHKEKMSVSQSIAIATLRSILPVFIFLLNIPILLFMKGSLQGDKFFHQFINVISVPVVVIIVSLIIMLFYPTGIKHAALRFLRLIDKMKFVNIERMITLEKKVFEGVDKFSQILWSYFREKRGVLLRAMLWILLAFITDFFIGMAVLWGFGYFPPLLKGLAIQFLIRPIIFLAPTPGGAGIWEFTYLGFFSMYMPNHLIGVAVLLWRMIMTYLPAIVGSVLLSREFRKDTHLRELIIEKGGITEEDVRNDEME